MANSIEIVFLPWGRSTCVSVGSSLMQAAGSIGLNLRSDCGNCGVCGQCRVFISETPDGPFREQLACQTILERSVFIRVPNESLLEQSGQKILTESFVEVSRTETPGCPEGIPLAEIVEIRASAPSRTDSTPDRERVVASMKTPQPEVPLNLLQSISKTLRESEENASWSAAAVVSGGRMIDLLSGNGRKRMYAAAIDIGTTTLAISVSPLDDLSCEYISARINPQNVFGDDIISRIRHCIENPGSLNRQQHLIVRAINELFEETGSRNGFEPTQIAVVTVAGNTVMQQLFLGIEPAYLGISPFVPVTREYPPIRGNEIGLGIHPNGLIYVLPILGGFVGGDLTAGIIATGIADITNEHGGASLLIDVGTNGEMVLVGPDGNIFAAATAAGPAFEGARIRHGMLAVTGAISSVRIKESLIYETIGNGEKAAGICGSALIDITAELLNHGAITSRGKLTPTCGGPLKNFWTTFEGKPALMLADESRSLRSDGPIVFTQQDIRHLQLASGAISSGIKLLLAQVGISPGNIDTLFLAGGFGHHIRPENAKRIGLIPREVPLERIRFCGNTSLAGAKTCLKNARKIREAGEISARSHHIDLSSCPDFQTVFAESMLFPE